MARLRNGLDCLSGWHMTREWRQHEVQFRACAILSFSETTYQFKIYEQYWSVSVVLSVSIEGQRSFGAQTIERTKKPSNPLIRSPRCQSNANFYLLLNVTEFESVATSLMHKCRPMLSALLSRDIAEKGKERRHLTRDGLQHETFEFLYCNKVYLNLSMN